MSMLSALLLAIAVICLNPHSLFLGLSDRAPTVALQWHSLWKASVLIFFGYVGWESMCSLLKMPSSDVQTLDSASFEVN
jgi:hypothetical protein